MNFEFNIDLMAKEFDKFFGEDRVKSLECTWSPILDENDIVDKILISIRDVTIHSGP